MKTIAVSKKPAIMADAIPSLARQQCKVTTFYEGKSNQSGILVRLMLELCFCKVRFGIEKRLIPSHLI